MVGEPQTKMNKELKCVAELRGHTDRVWCARWSPSGALLATCGGDQSVRLWARESSGAWSCRDVLSGVHARTVRRCAWSPSGSQLATASFDGTVGVWDVTHVDEIECTATLEGHENEVKDVAWSTSGSLLATCGRDKTVWVWEQLDDGEFECVSVLREHTQDVKTVVWHPQRDVLFSASYDDTIRIWSPDSDGEWACSAVLRGHESTVWALAFSADGASLFSVSDDRALVLWKPTADSAPAGKPGPLLFAPHSTRERIHARTVFAVDCERSSGNIATAGADNALRVFAPTSDAQSVELLAEVEAHAGDVNSAAWNPAVPGMLCSAGDDRVARIWQLV